MDPTVMAISRPSDQQTKEQRKQKQIIWLVIDQTTGPVTSSGTEKHRNDTFPLSIAFFLCFLYKSITKTATSNSTIALKSIVTEK